MGSWGGQLGWQHTHITMRWSWTSKEARIDCTRGTGLPVHRVGDPHWPIVRCCGVAGPGCSIH